MDVIKQFDLEGRVWFRNAISKSELLRLDELTDFFGRPGSRASADGALFSAIYRSNWAAALTRNWPNVRPVRVVSFDKSAQVNWGVPWHQDRIISVQDRCDLQGFGAWSRKEDVWHCEPPASILDHMLFVRVHLDDNTAENGAMEIALASHTLGAVQANSAADAALKFQREICAAKRGDILVLKMLTLHRSLPSKSDQPRRALRIDFAANSLPAPLEWNR